MYKKKGLRYFWREARSTRGQFREVLQHGYKSVNISKTLEVLIKFCNLPFFLKSTFFMWLQYALSFGRI